jgi:hypothetical protein
MPRVESSIEQAMEMVFHDWGLYQAQKQVPPVEQPATPTVEGD